MTIKLKKFGATLTSRQLGKEAFDAFQPSLKETAADEILEIDFAGIDVLSPSWGDEFLTPLQKQYQNRLFLKKTENPSVHETIALLEDIGRLKFQTK